MKFKMKGVPVPAESPDGRYAFVCDLLIRGAPSASGGGPIALFRTRPSEATLAALVDGDEVVVHGRKMQLRMYNAVDPKSSVKSVTFQLRNTAGTGFTRSELVEVLLTACEDRGVLSDASDASDASEASGASSGEDGGAWPAVDQLLLDVVTGIYVVRCIV